MNIFDREEGAMVASEFYQLGLIPFILAATQKRGVKDLLNALMARFAVDEAEEEEEIEEDDKDKARKIRIAIIGKPIVKSTLVNRILGEDRVVVCDRPGTTRDNYVDFGREGRVYTLVDTAGVRRRTKVHEKMKKFSLYKRQGY